VAAPFFALALVTGLFSLALLVRDREGLRAFLSVENARMVLTQTVVVAMAALGMTLIIVSGGIDLSVGSGVALTGVLTATWLGAGWPTGLAVGCGLLSGGLVGMVNGALIAGCRMMPFIVTLGTMGVCRGLAKWVANNQVVNVPEQSPVNLWMAPAESGQWMLVPPGVWVTLVLGTLLALILRHTLFGRHLFAVGATEAAAAYSGIRVAWLKFRTYGLAGLFFGCAGVLQMTRLSQGDPSGAVGLELDVIAAVVLGGASLNGGSGSIVGSLVGALTIQVLRNGSSLMLWPTFMQEIIIGLVIILAVGLDGWRRYLAGRPGASPGR
jgi:ribose transport system permease protein